MSYQNIMSGGGGEEVNGGWWWWWGGGGGSLISVSCLMSLVSNDSCLLFNISCLTSPVS